MSGVADHGESDVPAQPYRAQIDVCFVAYDEASVSAWWDRVHEALDLLGCTFSQGGMSERMDDEDVVQGSPLDEALRGLRAVRDSRRSETDPIAEEMARQLREGIGCLTCGTRFHGPSVNLDSGCPVCAARREAEMLRQAAWGAAVLIEQGRTAQGVSMLRSVMPEGYRPVGA